MALGILCTGGPGDSSPSGAAVATAVAADATTAAGLSDGPVRAAALVAPHASLLAVV